MPGDIISNPVALYLGGDVPEGTKVQGHFLIGSPGYDYSHNYGGYTWFPGPDEANRYLLGKFVGNHPSFWATVDKSDNAFVNLFNSIANRFGTARVASIDEARSWLDDHNFLYTNSLTPGEKSIIIFGQSIAGNYVYSILNYDSKSIASFDTGLSTSAWNTYDCVPVTGGGYMVIFQDSSDSTNYYLMFLDSSGVSLETTSFIGISYLDYDGLDGKWAFFIHPAGSLKYFDGKNVYTHGFDGTNYQMSVSWDFDATNSQGSFMTSLVKNSDGSGVNYLIKKDGSMTPTKSFDGVTYTILSILYAVADYIVYVTFDVGSSSYSNIEICGPDGTTTLQSIDTSIHVGYSGFDSSFYGPSSFMLVIWDSSDVSKPYVIINYEGDTNTLIQTTHARGANYTNPQIVAMGAESNLDINPNNGYLILYPNYTSYGFLFSVDYFDVVYFIAGESSARTYTLTSGTSTPVNLEDIGQAKSLFLGYVDTGTNQFGIQTINGASIVPNLLWPVEDISYITQGQFGTNFLIGIVSVIDGIGRMWVLDDTGAILDFTTFSNGSISITISYDTIYITDGTNAWYMNSVNSSFQSITYYPTPGVSPYYTVQYNTGNVFLWDHINSRMSVITRTGYTGDITLPELDRVNYYGANYFISVGKDVNGNYIIELYDLNVTLLNSDVTGSGNGTHFDIVENRVLITYGIDAAGQAGLLTPTTVVNSSLPNELGYIPNDYVWWTNNTIF